MNHSRVLRRVLILSSSAGLVLFALMMMTLFSVSAKEKASAASAYNAADSGGLFTAFVPVLRHPRCMNCHSQGNFPRQGDDGHPHTMNVRRGQEGHGLTAEKCST